jgi:hypothetical protein
MFLFDGTAPMQAGQEIFHSSDASQPAGMVVNAAGGEDGRSAIALIEVKLALLDAGELHLGAADGPLLHRVEMPYDVPREAATAD